MNKKNLDILSLVQIAMLSAILSVLAQISIPIPGGVPITLQTFGIFVIGMLLGPVKGTLSILLYLALGAVGIPVFANFKSGLSALVGPTGGFLIGFLPMVFMVGLGAKFKFSMQLFYNILGLIACYLFGLGMYYIFTNNTGLIYSLPTMLIKDFIISVVAVLFVKSLKPQLKSLMRN